jgi:subtilisin family serine protease
MRNLILIFTLFISPFLVYAQPANWQNLDLKTDSIFGISTEKAYADLLKGKTPTLVVVAVIDGGIDTSHEDLKAILWTNPKPGDKGDLHGWSFIGSAKGNVQYDNLELTRQVRQNAPRFEGKDSSSLKSRDWAAFHLYRKEKAELDAQLKKDSDIIGGISRFETILDSITKAIGKDSPTLADFQAYQPRTPREGRVRQIVIANLKDKDDFKAFKANGIDRPLNHYKDETDYQLNVNYDPRPLYVGDDYFNSKQRDYGSPDVNGPDPTHGTHVAGIIAAVRDNNLGIKGVADDVRIMAIRTVPDGDERDKDVANAIRYAADHGAKVINMSFGKGYAQDKTAVDDAVRYALKKDVLLVQAAGNSNEDIDTAANFPNRVFADGKTADACIVVGASGWKDDSTLKAPFSNYGKTAVDVFAPGEQIESSIPGSKYAAFDGTSMASPVVAGLAALIREYYPRLTAMQVKIIILQSVVKPDHPVVLTIGKTTHLVPLSDLCITGGVVNAYQALALAAKEAANP